MVHGRSDYTRVERALRFIHARFDSQPTLAEVAAEVGLSEFHFQRLFRRWAGVSPKRFLQYLTLEQAKRLLQETRSLLETSAAVELSGPGRLHELFLAIERMTPGEYKSGARGLSIHYGVEDTPLGPALFAALDRGLCGISFITEGGVAGARAELQRRWPGAKLVDDPEAIRTYANALRRRLHGDLDRPLSVVLKGTPFQLQVWEALLRIPPGQVVSYADVAELVGAPATVRAVGSAVSRNPIACLIPCHRVIQATGAFGDYHWGAARKVALLGLERSVHQTRPASSGR